MKQSSILTREFDRLVSGWSPGCGTSLCIKEFHLAALSALLDRLFSTVVIYAPSNLLDLLNERLQPAWESNRGLFFPPESSSGLTPEGFQSQELKNRRHSLSIIASLGDEVSYIVTTEAAWQEPVLTRHKEKPLILDESSEYELLIDWLAASGYERMDVVLSPGTYAVRGGIIDVFSLSAARPLRISFVDDAPVLQLFDIDSQLTQEKRSSYTLIKSDVSRGTLSLADYFQGAAVPLNLISETEFIIGGGPVGFTREFSLTALNSVEFVSRKQNSDVIEVSNRLSTHGFLDSEGRIVIPAWFTDQVEKSAPKRGAKDFIESLDLSDLEPGDYIVHRDHGVGIYQGLKTVENNGQNQEFLILEYNDGGYVFVSMEKFRRLSYYASRNEQHQTDSLTKQAAWKRKKASAKKQAEEAVASLISLYAERSRIQREPYTVDKKLESVFLSSFAFEDTEDQVSAWKDISEDLQKPAPMNRLLCGDVGFGKTEIAIRAAFRVVYGGKQVAVLAPTTILANQLYHSFKSRLSEFSIEVDVLSRFRTAAETREVKERIRSGALDVVVGTHAILSSDIFFKNIGLLIVDEEHRFGVAHKEKIQNIQNNIDVLYMSATPIPRTLHMAFSGIRNISTLFTPPKARLPINTQISYLDYDLIVRAIRFEVNRGGQVFFVHNKINSIEDVVQKLKGFLPELAIASAHGQEPPRLLEKTMRAFVRQEIDVLVSTSIIETGIDIPNANTIIINRAHLFGLSQLYQIRGRVGRGTRLAHAYLFIPNRISLNRDAFRRLKAIEENTSLGSGYNISKMDLEIRGAGTLFGYRQSGGSGGVGFELYAHFITDAIRKKAPESSETLPEIKVDDVTIRIYPDCLIPEDYIKPANIRIGFYRKLSRADTLSDLNAIEYEMQNRFGVAVESVKRLLFTTRARIECAYLGIEKITYDDGRLMFDLSSFVGKNQVEPLINLINEHFSSHNKNYWFKRSDPHRFTLVAEAVQLEDIPTLMMGFLDKLHDVFLINNYREFL